ncbi:MAG: proton-conducting transporter membrane subunit [Candidatus Omnitrophota bacterium]|jgi:formate hydrogenlyase subunit 3/multisubunit Na+/H+ antiporter MnhD subunit
MNLTYPYFKLGALNSFILLAIGMFFVLTLVYSLKFMKGRKRLFEYYTYITLTALASAGVVFTNNLLILIVFCGFLGFTLFVLIGMGEDKTGETAKKTFIIVGATDVIMLLGIGIIYYLTGTLQMDQIRIGLKGNSYLPYLAYLCIAVGCFAKAGVMPFHSWIPDASKSAPVPVAAYLPASLDKLLGFYLLIKATLYLFVMNNGMNIFLMLIGAVTIVAAAMMALVEDDMKKLLGFSTVSQMGYMVLGLGSGSLIGIAGGVFHMLNHAIYKSCLFFDAGNVEYRMKTTALDKLGGLAGSMPVTYGTCLIASLSIAGVPPLSGFFSKWMIYQGIIGSFGTGVLRPVAGLCLIAALFGSGLTLASFMKLLHAVFLGQRSETGESEMSKVNEVSWTMLMPCVILASLCVIFGIFARELPLKYWIFPAIGQVSFIGNWYAGLSAFLILAGLIVGLLIFKFSVLKIRMRNDPVFTGGEPVDFKPNAVSGTDFYNAVKEYGILKAVYKKAHEGYFDIYEQAKKLKVFSLPLRFLHNGVLPTYMVWILLGMVALFFILM